MATSFGARLREERSRRQLTQEQFAAIGGVSRVSQHLYENDARCPDTDYLSKLAEHGIDVGKLLMPERVEHRSPDRSALLMAFRVVDQMARDALGNPLPLDERERHFNTLITALETSQPGAGVASNPAASAKTARAK